MRGGWVYKCEEEMKIPLTGLQRYFVLYTLPKVDLL
jgi:hypothetical protein